MTEEFQETTEEECAAIYADFLVAMQKRRRDFVTGTIATAAIVGTLMGIAAAIVTDYTWRSILAIAIMSAFFYGVGCYSGYTFADEVVKVRKDR